MNYSKNEVIKTINDLFIEYEFKEQAYVDTNLIELRMLLNCISDKLWLPYWFFIMEDLDDFDTIYCAAYVHWEVEADVIFWSITNISPEWIYNHLKEYSEEYNRLTALVTNHF